MKAFVLIAIFFGQAAYALPTMYDKKDHIKTSVTEVGQKTYFTFGFTNSKGVYTEWSWNHNTEKLDVLSKGYGLYNPNEELYYSPDTLKSSMFRKHPLYGILPDYNTLISYYYDSVTPLYKKWKKFSEEDNLSKRESLTLLLNFFQDFPYGVPPSKYNGYYIAGLFIAPLIFKNGWADCDSKSLLMATVLAHDDYFKDKLAMILVPGHALLGISILPSPYDDVISHRYKKYVVAEPTGLGRTPLGQKNSPYSKVLIVDPITVKVSNFSSYDSNDDAGSDSSTINQASNKSDLLTQEDCIDNGLLIDYISVISNARTQTCQLKVSGEYLNHGPQFIFDKAGKVIERNIFKMGTQIQE